MENKINIAELLKDCPKGMELDCTIFSGLEFDRIDENNGSYPIICRTKTTNGKYHVHTFTKHGCYSTEMYSKCVIYPKDETTWEGFVPPCEFKDGDILATDLGSVFYLNTRLNTDEYYGCYVGIGGDGSFHICAPFAYKECCGLATEEEKQKLFKAIKDNGYKWNAESKTLETLIEPKFKVGDNIRIKGTSAIYVVTEIREDCYMLDDKSISLLFKNQDQWELVPNKFDITTLKPFDKVLSRDNDFQKWGAELFSFYNKETKDYRFQLVGTICARRCIPFEGNQHLLGTTDDCDEYYKTWINEEE